MGGKQAYRTEQTFVPCSIRRPPLEDMHASAVGVKIRAHFRNEEPRLEGISDGVYTLETQAIWSSAA